MNTNEPTTPSAIRSGEPLWCADCKSYHPIGLHTDTPSAAPTPETDAEWEKEENSNRYPHQYVSAKFARRLERERDEARAELARLKANNRYQRGYHDGEQAAREELKTPTPPTEGSAVEWAKEQLAEACRVSNQPCLETIKVIFDELARRADEAEFWAKSWKANHDNQVRLKRALAAQAEARELREALADMHSGWRYIRAVYGDLAGVGWDRAEQKARAALAKKEGGRDDDAI